MQRKNSCKTLPKTTNKRQELLCRQLYSARTGRDKEVKWKAWPKTIWMSSSRGRKREWSSVRRSLRGIPRMMKSLSNICLRVGRREPSSTCRSSRCRRRMISVTTKSKIRWSTTGTTHSWSKRLRRTRSRRWKSAKIIWMRSLETSWGVLWRTKAEICINQLSIPLIRERTQRSLLQLWDLKALRFREALKYLKVMAWW